MNFVPRTASSDGVFIGRAYVGGFAPPTRRGKRDPERHPSGTAGANGSHTARATSRGFNAEATALEAHLTPVAHSLMRVSGPIVGYVYGFARAYSDRPRG